MKTTLAAAACFSLLLGAAGLSAGEPAKAGTPADAGALSPKKLQKMYSKTVEKHVKAQTKKQGAFVVHDDVLNKDWRLKLVRIHTDRIVELGDGRFFACADLKEVGGGKTKLDLDFYVVKQGDQWVMEKVLVHKVSGKPRYTYNDNNEMVPVP